MQWIRYSANLFIYHFQFIPILFGYPTVRDISLYLQMDSEEEGGGGGRSTVPCKELRLHFKFIYILALYLQIILTLLFLKIY